MRTSSCNITFDPNGLPQDDGETGQWGAGREPDGSDQDAKTDGSESIEAPLDEEAEANAERAIEGDFRCELPRPSYGRFVTRCFHRRLVNNIKGGEHKQTGISSSVWDISIEEAEGFDLHQELKEASGIGRRKRRGVSVASPLILLHY